MSFPMSQCLKQLSESKQACHSLKISQICSFRRILPGGPTKQPAMGDPRTRINPIKNIVRFSPVRPTEDNSDWVTCPNSGRLKLFYSLEAIFNYLPIAWAGGGR